LKANNVAIVFERLGTALIQGDDAQLRMDNAMSGLTQ
jgi:hypothetical protein